MKYCFAVKYWFYKHKRYSDACLKITVEVIFFEEYEWQFIISRINTGNKESGLLQNTIAPLWISIKYKTVASIPTTVQEW